MDWKSKIVLSVAWPETVEKDSEHTNYTYTQTRQSDSSMGRTRDMMSDTSERDESEALVKSFYDLSDNM